MSPSLENRSLRITIIIIMRKKYFLLLIMAMSLNCMAQKKAKLLADKAYDRLSYLKAADYYQQLGENSLDAVAKAKLADSYRLNGDTESAEYWYAQAAKETKDPEDILHYAQVLQSNGKCETALGWYNQYRSLMGEDYPLPRAKVTDCTKLVFNAKQQFNITNIRQLNSSHLDYSPVPYKEGIVFTSTRGRETNAFEDAWTKDNFSDLFFAKKMGHQSFGAVALMEGTINGNFHDGAATFNQAGMKMYFSRNSDNGKNSKEIVDLKIYSAELLNGKWENVIELPFNHSEYTSCHPTLSADGNTLYFASNRPGGLGGMDIYKSTRSGNDWSLPENLGASVNTAGNEIFPFVNQSNTLYFASDGLQGVGGLDIYQTQLKDDFWALAENLGAPINSPKDDFGYSQLANGESGYFSSNRVGGFGGDDIYLWSKAVVSGNTFQNLITVVDEVSNNRISNALVTIVEGVYKNKNSIPRGKMVKNGEIEASDYWARPISFLTDVKGNVQPDVRNGKTYTILIEKSGYTPIKKVVNSYELSQTGEWVVPLKKRKGLALNGTVIHQEYNRFMPNARVQLFNLCTGEYENTVSDDEGNFDFFLECNCDYELEVKKERFLADKKKYSTLGINCQSAKPLTTILYLNVDEPESTATQVIISAPPPVNTKATSPQIITKPAPVITETFKVGQVITLEDVYYDFNEATISRDASNALDNLVTILSQYPSMEIQLFSHTDSRGDKIYNEHLSQKRAEAAVEYIVSRGISRSRLSGKGYGEWLLKNDCGDNVDCEEWQHQENRRTEVKITKLDANVKVNYRRK